MISKVKSYAELCLENQRLREQNRQLRLDKRLSLLQEVVQENIELEEIIKSQKVWIAYLEARLKRNDRTAF